MFTGSHNVRAELQGRGMATQQRHVVLRSSPKQLGFGRVHLQAICCHPMADVHDALTEMSCGGGYVVAMTMHVKLRVISVCVELHIVLVYRRECGRAITQPECQRRKIIGYALIAVYEVYYTSTC